MVNSEDTDQTATLGAVWSGSALFGQTYLSKNLGLLIPGPAMEESTSFNLDSIQELECYT